MPNTVNNTRIINRIKKKELEDGLFILYVLGFDSISEKVVTKIIQLFCNRNNLALVQTTVNTTTDIEIIRIVLAGNTGMYSLLVNRYKNKVFSLAYAVVSNREDAEEIAQDAFVKAFKGLASFKERSSFSTWMYRIVVNTALNKKKLKKLVIVDDTDRIKQDEPFGFESLTEYLKKDDQKKFIRMALDALNKQEKLCITLSYLNELSVKEIQEITGISESNIKVLLLRGRKHLYEQLKKLLRSEVKNLI